jgi:hypothetical protein
VLKSPPLGQYETRNVQGGRSLLTILNRAYVVSASCFIAAVLLGQAYVTFSPVLGSNAGFRFWPIVTYAMYSRAHYEGETVEVYDLLEGTLNDGTVVEIPMDSLGLSIWYYRNMLKGLRNQDPVAIKLLTSRFRWGDDLAEVRIKSYPLMVTRDGPAEKPSELLYSLTMPGTRHAETVMPASTATGAPAATSAKATSAAPATSASASTPSSTPEND